MQHAIGNMLTTTPVVMSRLLDFVQIWLENSMNKANDKMHM